MNEPSSSEGTRPVVVSDRAKAGLDHFVVQAARSSLGASGASFEYSQVDDGVPPEREVVMLTVSSYLYRVLLFIHFNRDAVTRSHFAALSGLNADALDQETFNDTVMERGNLWCGAFNRDLAHFVPHLGMSTPCILHRSSMEHIAAVKPAYTRRYRADIGGGLVLHMTLALCAFADLDFPFEPRQADVAAEETAGELEMF